MKILLFEDFSGYHATLKEGIKSLNLGHHVALASSGDGWKKTGGADIDLGGKFSYHFNLMLKNKLLAGYDVVQFMSPILRYELLGPWDSRYFLSKIRDQNDRSFLMSAGCNAYRWRAINQLRYHPYEDCRVHEINGKKFWFERPEYVNWNVKFSESVNGVIPDGIDYLLGYSGERNIRSPIYCGVNTDRIPYKSNIVKKKLVVYHGVSRYGFKGTQYIEKAFNNLNRKYKNEIECIIGPALPLTNYLKLLENINVLVDETSLYAPYMNAVFGMAMGRVVMGGSEPEYLKDLEISQSPVINILPNSKDIETKIEKILASKGEIEGMGFYSREFVEKHHSHKKMARSFLAQWVR